FYTQPTPVIENANSFTTSATPIPQQICDIVNSCPLNAIYGSLSTSMPSTTEHTTQYTSTYSTTTPFYQPQYDEPFASPATVHSDYSNGATYASNINYAPNSNYQFLNASLQQQYLGNNGIYSAPLYDESNQENPPILTNAEQNQVSAMSSHVYLDCSFEYDLFPMYSAMKTNVETIDVCRKNLKKQSFLV
uniref:Eyes absent homolog n=1 Tax=Ascaris lumbricoides TaxID=6252 RepID=A0A0M3HQ00_ASCLU